MVLQELQIDIPVRSHHAVTAIVYVVAQVMKDGLLWCGPSVGAKVLFA